MITRWVISSKNVCTEQLERLVADIINGKQPTLDAHSGEMRRLSTARSNLLHVGGCVGHSVSATFRLLYDVLKLTSALLLPPMDTICSLPFNGEHRHTSALHVSLHFVAASGQQFFFRESPPKSLVPAKTRSSALHCATDSIHVFFFLYLFSGSWLRKPQQHTLAIRYRLVLLLCEYKSLKFTGRYIVIGLHAGDKKGILNKVK